MGALLVFTAIFHSVYRQTRDKNKEKKPAVTAKVHTTPFHDTPFHDTPSHNTHFHNTPSCHDTHVVILAYHSISPSFPLPPRFFTPQVTAKVLITPHTHVHSSFLC